MTKILASARPTPRQLQFQEWEFGVFLHFGIRSFYEGHRDWDGKPMEAAQFNPSELDCNQWAESAREGGAKYMVLTAKHHDGFANWQSDFSQFSVAQSPWKNGKGDVVREYVEACRKHDLGVGIYYSPAESSPLFESGDAEAFDSHFLNQISELMGNYGPIDMLWFDGCGSADHEYDWPRIMKEIRRLQPEILIFNMGGEPDYRWIGNEGGMAPFGTRNTVQALDFAIDREEKELLAQPLWLPAECDARMRGLNWFFEEGDVGDVKTLDELMGIYEFSIGRGCNLLVNIGPDRRGLLPEPDRTRLVEWRHEINRRFGSALVEMSDFEREGDVWTCDLPQHGLIDAVELAEDLSQGEAVRRFEIYAASTYHGGPVLAFEGRAIGHKQICRFPAVKARQVVVKVTQSDAPPVLRAMKVHWTQGD